MQDFEDMNVLQRPEKVICQLEQTIWIGWAKKITRPNEVNVRVVLKDMEWPLSPNANERLSYVLVVSAQHGATWK